MASSKKNGRRQCRQSATGARRPAAPPSDGESRGPAQGKGVRGKKDILGATQNAGGKSGKWTKCFWGGPLGPSLQSLGSREPQVEKGARKHWGQGPGRLAGGEGRGGTAQKARRTTGNKKPGGAPAEGPRWRLLPISPRMACTNCDTTLLFDEHRVNGTVRRMALTSP